MDLMTIGWMIAFVVFLVVELATLTALVSIWIAVGALAAMFFAIGGFSFAVQLVAFIVTSVILLIITRPLARKLQSKKQGTNYELDVGKTALVIESINNELSEGRVKLDGTDWAARSVDNSLIEKGEIVTVDEVDGSKLIVSQHG